ncbi:MAG: 2-C-methyl-D-erythritol 4-phosphate cytidylyltransferase [Pyrinomonadaceae bacterium]
MNVAIIAAGGRGERLGGERPKQFLSLGGKPIIIHTLHRFERAAMIGEVVVVLPPTDVAGFITLTTKYNLRKLVRVVPGGQTRSESVYKGLQTLRSATTGIVAVHDGVRPFVTPEEIDRTVGAAAEFGAAILMAPPIDTIKEVAKGHVVRTLPRASLRHALTPQCFRYDIIRRAYEDAIHAGSAGTTDDSALVERMGIAIAVIDGDPRNIKITRPQDLMLAELLIKDFQDDAQEGWS